jgi:hypothetical protein
MRETSGATTDGLPTSTTSSSSQASQDEDGTAAIEGRAVKSEPVKLERMDEQQQQQHGVTSNGAPGVITMENMGMNMTIGDGSFGLMPPFGNGSFDAALGLSLEDPFMESELESGWWDNLNI